VRERVEGKTAYAIARDLNKDAVPTAQGARACGRVGGVHGWSLPLGRSSVLQCDSRMVVIHKVGMPARGATAWVMPRPVQAVATPVAARAANAAGATSLENALTASRRDDLKHGTNAAYVAGCVCRECRANQRMRMARHRT